MIIRRQIQNDSKMLCQKRITGENMTSRARGKLARWAKTYYREQMDLQGWLMLQAEEQEVLNQVESSENLSEDDEYEILQQIIILLAEDIEEGKFKQLFFGAK
jgi:hypothetical protein